MQKILQRNARIVRYTLNFEVKFYDATRIHKLISHFYCRNGYFVFADILCIEEKRQGIYQAIKLPSVLLVAFYYCFCNNYFI